jgi:hypothetical protein
VQKKRLQKYSVWTHVFMEPPLLIDPNNQPHWSTHWSHFKNKLLIDPIDQSINWLTPLINLIIYLIFTIFVQFKFSTKNENDWPNIYENCKNSVNNLNLKFDLNKNWKNPGPNLFTSGLFLRLKLGLPFGIAGA